MGICKQLGSLVRAVHAVDGPHSVDDIAGWELKAPAPAHAHGEACRGKFTAHRGTAIPNTYGVMCTCPVGQRVLGGCTMGSCLQASTSFRPAALCIAAFTLKVG